MRSAAFLGAAIIAATLSTGAQAGELFAGIHAHDVKTPLDDAGIESGVDLSLGYRWSSIGHLWNAELRPYIFGALNTQGDTSYAAAGVAARFPLGRHWYVRPGLGIAIHTGSAGKYYRTDKIAFGSRVLFEPEIALGTKLTSRVGVEASWVHMSHAQIFGKENPGIDNLGLRVNLAL
ncbi:MAG TPA: acyloxyacyl hydrolase [Sphingomicrobium sp.]|nr:acyloxyacyl hydrolase [Sphingomicrobium sp.]